ncbi:MAG TPA: DUF2071 domain-containing protein [Gemmatimonadaceae bacterium]|nr:DUF2071 domain-containing protein [Gemmatimonadaceae bacterium]
MCGSTSEPVTAISASSASSNFLTAEWRDLVMINYEVGPETLASRVPAGTTLDLRHGRALVTAVGFQFLDTRVRGIAVPFHRDFDEATCVFMCSVAVATKSGSEAAFVTQRHWGYTRQRDGSTVEYHVAHPLWRVCRARDAIFETDVPSIVAARGPISAYLVDGSAVQVSEPRHDLVARRALDGQNH